MSKENKYCKYCWPVKRKNHLFLYIDYYLTRLTNSNRWPLKFLDKRIEDFWNLLLEFLSLFKIVRFINNPDESKLLNRGLIFFKEGKSRGLDIKAVKIGGRYINEFKFIHNGKSYYYDNIPLTIFDKNVNTSDKQGCKNLLKKNRMPVANGGVFQKKERALDFGKETGFPLVVKPIDSSLSCHVSYPVNSKKELLKAIEVAKRYKPAFMVEEFIPGSLFRVDVVGGSNIFVCRKEKPNVVGDGESTIEELIEIKNESENRGSGPDSTLYEIPITEKLIKNLESKNLTLKTIPPEEKEITLYNKKILSLGCDVVSVNNQINKENKDLFFEIAEVFKADLIGIDFICPDISKSYKEQETAVIEVNNLPYSDMHQNPSSGSSAPVAEIVWDITLSRLET